MKTLSESLKKNTSLKTIRLSYNNIGNAGIKALSDAFKFNPNNSLEYISLLGNKI